MIRQFFRHFSTTSQKLERSGLSTKRVGTTPKKDTVEGERGVILADELNAYELPTPNLMNQLFNGTKFKDIPVLSLKCTSNNTKMTLAIGPNLNPIAAKSTGTEGFKNCRKGTTVAAQAVANRIVTLAKDNNIEQVRFVFNGLGPGRSAAFKVIEDSGLKVVSLSDRTRAIEPWIQRPRKKKRL